MANLRARKTPFLLLSKFNPPKIFIGIHMLLLSKHIMYERSEELPSFSISGEGLRWEFIKEHKKVKKQENKMNSTKKVIKKKRKFFSFSLGHFLVRVLVFFFIAFLVEFLFSCFLTFLFSFINSHLRRIGEEVLQHFTNTKHGIYYPWRCQDSERSSIRCVNMFLSFKILEHSKCIYMKML